MEEAPTLETLRLSDYSNHLLSKSNIHFAELPQTVKPKPRRTSTVARPTRSAFRQGNNREEGPRVEDLSEEGLQQVDECSDGAPDNQLLGTSINVHNDKGGKNPEGSKLRPDTWDNVRDAMFSKFVSTSSVRAAIVKGRRDTLYTEIQENIIKHSKQCPTCGFVGKEGNSLLKTAKTLRQQQVLWIGVSYRFIVTVPVRVCPACDSPYSCCPLDVGSLPGSPEEAWNIVRCKEDHIPIWFDLNDLVRFFEAGTNIVRRLSVVKIAEWLDRAHVENGCPSTVPFDKFRKCLGVALRELGYMLCRMSALEELGVELWPTGK